MGFRGQEEIMVSAMLHLLRDHNLDSSFAQPHGNSMH